MPQYTVDIPGKGQFDVNSPVELTDEQAYQAVRSQIGKETPQKEGTAGFFEGLVGGTKNILSASQTAVEAPFISGEEASLRGIERQKERTERPGFSLDEITKTYKEDGIFSAAGETLSQVPGAIGEQLPFLASMKAGFMAGSALPLPPQAKALAGVAGSLLAPFLVSSGSAMERKASEQLKKGDKVDINELGAYGTGLASAGLERAALGLSGLSKVMGIDFLKGAGTETAEQIARRSLAATLAKGGTKLVLAESPTEAGQQLLERYYAGLSLTDEEAQREYVEAAAGAAILAPLGMAGSGYQRRQAKKIIQKRKDEIERITEENKRIQEEKIRAQEQAEAITAEEAKLERQRIEQEAEQTKLEVEAELQRARETGEPIKTIQQIINERTGVVQDPLNEKQLADIAKIDAERDKVFSQLKANRDLGVITEDEYKGKLLFLNDEVNKAKKELSQKQVKEKKPLTKQQLNKKRKEFEEALNLPSGYFNERDAKFTTSDVDPETGERTFVERELTQAEAMNIPVVPPPQFNPAKDAVTKEFITSETKGLGIGGTAKAFGLDHGDGPVPFLKDFLDGKNPRDLKDNEMIRLTLNENLKTRRKGLDNAPSLEAQQKRQEVITKIETYLDALPTEGEILNEQFIDEAARRGDEMAGRPLDPADAALSSIADAGRTDESAAAIDESTRREGEQPPALDPVTGEPTFTKEEVDAQQAEQLKQQAAELKKGANKTRSFNTLLNKVGIAKEDMLDIMGESKMPRKGFGLAFKTGAPKFVDSLNNGVFNDYLPFDMRLGDETTYEQLSEKTDKAFEYLTSAMREGRDLKPYEAELDFDTANNLEKEAGKITGAVVEINGQSIPKTLIDAYKSRKPDRDSSPTDLNTSDYYRELEKYLGAYKGPKNSTTIRDLENLIEEYVKSQPQDLRYVVFGKIKGTDVETVWQEKVGGKQRAEEIAKTLEQEGKATDTRVQEYDLNLGPAGIPQQAATPKQEQSREEYLRDLNFYLNNRIDGGIYAPYAEPMFNMYERLGMPQTEMSLQDAPKTAQEAAELKKGAQDDIQESRTSPPDTERDKLLAQYRADKYMEDSHIRQGERVPKWLQARLKKLEAQLKVQESRNIEGTGESKAAVIDSLRKEFGPDIDKSIESGQLVVVDYLSELPYTVSLTGTANGAYSPTSNKVYIVASKVMPGQGRKVLLHELGEHYGLERLLGKDYKSTLDRLKTLKNTDPEVEAIWASVKRDYPELTENSQQYLQEVMARVGERAPRSTIFKRVMSLVKNFLRKLGFFNPNKLSTADLQDLIAYSTRVSLAKSGEVQPSSIKDLSIGLTPVQLSRTDFDRRKRLKKLRQQIKQDGKNVEEIGGGFEKYGLTLSPGEMLYHGVPRPLGNKIRDNNNILLSQPPMKSQGGLTTEGGLIFFHQEIEYASLFSRQQKTDQSRPFDEQVGPMDRGNVFGFEVNRPLKVISTDYEINKKEAEMLNKLLNTPDYKQIRPGMDLQLIATYRADYARNIAKYGAVNYRDGKVIYRDKDDEPTTDETLAKGYGMGPLRPMYIDRITSPWPVILKALGFDGYYNGFESDSGAPQIALGMGDLQTELMFSKVANDVPAGLEATGVYLAGNNDNSTTVYQNFVEGFEKAKNNPKGILQDIYTSGRINLAYAGAGIERKLINEFEGAVTDGYGTTRADIIMAQALESSVLAAQSAQDGRVQFTEAGTAEVVNDKNNINNLIQLRQQLADQTSVEFAEGLVQSYTSARRYRLELDRLEQRARNIAARKAVIKTAKKDLKTAKGGDKKVLDKLITDYQKQNTIDENKNESVEITDEQKAAIAPGLAYAQQYPVLIEMGEMIDAINVNRINLLEESGVYSKDKANDYRERKGYVPLFREVLDDLAQGDAEVKKYFNGFADIGREYAFTGSEKASKHVINNLLQQHFWATNAALRNNANYRAAQQVALHNENNELILTDKKPEGNTSAPVFVEGERKFAEYSDPSLAIGIQGALPVYTGALAWFGKASKWFRIGITANPIFQAYQVVNDALGAAMYSGVSNPFQLGKRIIGGFVGDQFMGSTQAIDAQMARLGIAGGFGRTSEDIFMRAQRDLGVENMTKWTKLTDSVESFASKSDLAQRRGIFQQTLIETGGVLQADGTVEGGNQVLAMNRSLNIINWQKRGASGFVRAMTHVIPFANAYLQGMDVLINAMTGKGLSGTDAQTARILFLKTALTLTLINAVYSMLVAGSEEYDELDDRIKFRNYIVPGTGFKLPIRAEISLLTKFIPEQTYQVVSKMNTVNEVDATKLRQAMSLALMDAALGPNLFPQAIRGGVEVATNYNFYTGRPLIGLGLNRLATEEQYNEATSQLSKLLGQTGMIAPINADHLIRSYFGTIGATALFTIDQGANVFFDEKLPAPRLKDFPIISPLIYSAQGRDRLNDFYDLKESSDKVTATVNRLTKYDPDKAREYRKDNKKLLSTRNQVNQMANRLKDLRARRKQVIESTMDATAKRKALENLDKQMSLTARSISRLRIASGL